MPRRPSAHRAHVPGNRPAGPCMSGLTSAASPAASFLPSPHPPQLSKGDRYRDLISIQVVHTINAALCEYHLRHCPPSEQLLAVCAAASKAYDATMREVRAMDEEMACADSDEVGRRAARVPHMGLRWLTCPPGAVLGFRGTMGLHGCAGAQAAGGCTDCVPLPALLLGAACRRTAETGPTQASACDVGSVDYVTTRTACMH